MRVPVLYCSSVFARHQLLLGRNWVGKHLIMVLKPSSVTIRGQPNPRKISEKKRLKLFFPLFFFMIFERNLFVGWFTVGYFDVCLVETIIVTFSNPK